MTVKITGDEQEQILQTIEMFEVIAQSNPDDYQSLALLRDAYAKLGRHNDVLRVRKLLSGVFMRMGQYLHAKNELQLALEQNPSDEEAAAALEEASAQLASLQEQPPPLENHQTIDLDFDMAGEGSGVYRNDNTSLIEMEGMDGRSGAVGGVGDSGGVGNPAMEITEAELPEGDGNEPLAEFLIQSEIIRRETVEECFEKVRERNAGFSPDKVSVSLLEEVLRQGTVEEEEEVYSHILNHTKFGFMPLNYYDVDKQILKMLPEQLTLGRLIVPFDLISRTLMIAVCNPFDGEGRQAAQALLDYNIQWYFATPAAITAVLCDCYRIELPKNQQA